MQILGQPEVLDEMGERFLSIDIDIILAPATAAQLVTYTNFFSIFDLSCVRTDAIDFFEMGSILSKTTPGSQEWFSYFRCFRRRTWIFILVSLIVLSLISAMMRTTKNTYCGSIYYNFGEFFWNYFILLFQKSLQSFIIKSSFNYILTFVWVISAFFLAIQFGAYLLDYMVKVQPIYTIDSIDDLAKSELTIMARSEAALFMYAQNGETELAKKLLPLISDYQAYYMIEQELIDGLKQGTHAWVNQRLIIIFTVLMMSEKENTTKEQEHFIDSLHISKEDGGLEPYFMFINTKSDERILPWINEMFVNHFLFYFDNF